MGCRTNTHLLLLQYISTFYEIIFRETYLENKDIKYQSYISESKRVTYYIPVHICIKA